MKLPIWPAIERGRLYAFPAVWAAVLVTGVGLRQPLLLIDVTSLLTFNADERLSATLARQSLVAMDAAPTALTFVRHDSGEPDEASQSSARDVSGGHGRFAAPGNAVRRQVQLRPINPRTADELAGFFRDVAYSLTDIRQGEAVPPIKVQRVPRDLGTKDGSLRKALFITALLPVILDVNQRLLP